MIDMEDAEVELVVGRGHEFGDSVGSDGMDR